ncbi:hypothetical protein PV433_00840 [Paenibacillus sp. GYB004]|uniref:hypothetical protein n=1 Tax=Paenibacillus sp. GYB004 TaxID=2994393 RepID=UPI002F9696DE
MKSLKLLLSFVLSLILVFPLSASAETASPVLDKAELKKLHKQVFDLVSEGKEDMVSSLPLFQKYDKFFHDNPKLKSEYVSGLDVYNPKKLKNKNQITTSVKGSKTFYVMEDGSFMVLSNTVTGAEKAKNKVNTLSVLQDTGEQWYNGGIGQSFTNDARQDIWGITKTGEMHLVTKYTIDSTSATITTVNTTGTRSWFPGGFSSQTATIVDNSARVVKSAGNYIYTVTCPVGWGICSTATFDIETTVDIKSAGGGNISFTVRSIVNG